ncbi:hypothetical protein KB20921_24120 [Edwardsiella ictaluri]|nr:hypothetical protein KH20906_23930 [Edwardsiella ictaluri]BEI03151.1 hypothetical protein KB20921_24120 [Edwardsiella ictaluri]BEI06612.1 hypothetical protein KH201010_23980 [Edwardsiella ictaluri]BEI10076.1 hypothetical protein STU22726_24070 [Edwardsiella ictaluri]BEI13555.1 hypothetical protein STU22816_24080 [Edwardsiella ictaluri]
MFPARRTGRRYGVWQVHTPCIFGNRRHSAAGYIPQSVLLWDVKQHEYASYAIGNLSAFHLA